MPTAGGLAKRTQLSGWDRRELGSAKRTQSSGWTDANSVLRNEPNRPVDRGELALRNEPNRPGWTDANSVLRNEAILTPLAEVQYSNVKDRWVLLSRELPGAETARSCLIIGGVRGGISVNPVEVIAKIESISKKVLRPADGSSCHVSYLSLPQTKLSAASVLPIPL